MRVIHLPDAGFDGFEDLRVRSLAFDRQSRVLAAVVGDAERSLSVHWWDLRRNAVRDQGDAGLLSNDNKDTWADPALSPDLGVLACTGHQDTAGADYILLMQRSDAWQGRRTLARGGEDNITAVAFAPDGKSLVAAVYGYEEQVIARWDVAAALRRPAPKNWFDEIIPPLAGVSPEPPGEVTCLAFAPDGGVLAAGQTDRSVQRWDVATGRPLPALRVKGRRRRPVRRLAFSPDGRTLAVAAGPAVTLFDGATGAVRAVLDGHEEDVADVAFHPAGALVATVCGGDALRLWDVAGTERQRLDCEVGPLWAVAFAPDGCTGAAGGPDGVVVQWDVAEP